MAAESTHRSNGIGRPWLALCFALAVHVAEEAFTGFLPSYSDATRAVSELLPFVT